jgi:hypothetical protein
MENISDDMRIYIIDYFCFEIESDTYNSDGTYKVYFRPYNDEKNIMLIGIYLDNGFNKFYDELYSDIMTTDFNLSGFKINITITEIERFRELAVYLYKFIELVESTSKKNIKNKKVKI